MPLHKNRYGVLDISTLPVLDKKQVGHLRHIENLAQQPKGDWSHMSGRHPFQEDFGSYRFQLAFMAYALGLTHFHRLPAAPGAFRNTFDRLTQKMLHPDVWMYWRDASQGGAPGFNAHLRGKLPQRLDPVAKDNIMYSAYVQSMALMYNFLFDDDKYAQPGALTMRIDPFFWVADETEFVYDQNSLNEHLYWQMVESGYLGIACEPNCVFQICNQPAILGFRLHDLLTGGSTAREVTQGYLKTWGEFGMLGENGHYNVFVREDDKRVVPNIEGNAWSDAWLGALMNTWNSDFVRQHYEQQIGKVLIKGPDATLSVKLTRDRKIDDRVVDLEHADFGWVAVWASEMGDAATLDGLLAHADRYMNPTWEKGGLYYPRNDEPYSTDGTFTLMEPITGNALLSYACLNVPNGLRAMYNHPWDKSHFRDPSLTEISPNVDVLRAWFDRDSATLVFTLSKREDRRGDAIILIDDVWGRGHWTLSCDGLQLASGNEQSPVEVSTVGVKRSGDRLELSCPVEKERTFVLSWTHSLHNEEGDR